MKTSKSFQQGQRDPRARYEAWTPEFEAVMEVERETPFEEQAGVCGCVHVSIFRAVYNCM
jgi:hypothetical protein